MGQYLITQRDREPFITDWYLYENHYEHGVDMVIYDLRNGTYTTDGLEWLKIDVDHL